MTYYISGMITGKEEAARKEFAFASQYVRWTGNETVNPFDNGLTEDDTWERHLAVDILNLLHCDAILQLPGWENSRGARLEYEIAIRIKIPVISFEEFQRISQKH